MIGPKSPRQLSYLKTMMRNAELEINHKVLERAKRLEDPMQRHRHLVEQERQKYLLETERIIKSLCELERFVEDLKKESLTSNRTVTLKDVEDGAFLLRQVGEAVATLKGEFPTLQNKMRAILRIEVEAVRFLKEEPHKLDLLLKRVRSMTEILTTLRRHVTDSLLKGVDPSQAAQYNAMEKATAAEVLKNQEETTDSQHLQQNVAESPAEVSVKSEMIPISTVTVHHAQSSPVVTHQSQHSFTLVSQVPNSPLTNSPGPAIATSSSSPTYMESTTMTTINTQQIQVPHSPPVPVNNNMQSLFIEELHNASTRNRALSIEKAEKKWEEKRQNLDHYDGQEFEKLLEEAQANIMKSIPNLDIPSQVTVSPKADAAQVSEDSPKTEQELEKAVKSPPPPPPRRSYVLGSGLSTRLSEVSYTARKDNTISKESSEDSVQAASSKLFPEKNVSLQSASTPMKDKEEEEGDKIMAELQAFQKCSYMDINSNNHAQQSRNDTHKKDARSVALTHPKEKKNSTNTSQTSRMPIPAATKSRQGGVDKTIKQHKLQDQRQYRQANGSAKKAGGDYKAISPILSASKIPAFSSTSGKSSSMSSSDSTNLPSLSTKASIPSNSLSPPTGRPTHSSSLIPSVANGSLKFQNPTHTGKGHSHLLLSTQTQNGRPTPLPPSSFSSTSSSSPSSISTTLPNQSMKNIRSIHTPSFTSYKSQNGSVSKATASSTITKEPS
uniref:Actin interacting protein 3-like C-terminal domain-containing protein n=1 Tax=Naja naja TaxID=35670 RepID=A0A8C6XNT5_NAJNA